MQVHQIISSYYSWMRVARDAGASCKLKRNSRNRNAFSPRGRMRASYYLIRIYDQINYLNANLTLIYPKKCTTSIKEKSLENPRIHKLVPFDERITNKILLQLPLN